jgi:transcriptional regulator with XRE-family HTH domain
MLSKENALIRVRVNRKNFDIALIRHNLSQADLARKMSYSAVYVSNVLNNRREPSAQMRRLILEYLPGYTFDDLFIIEQVENKD